MYLSSLPLLAEEIQNPKYNLISVSISIYFLSLSRIFMASFGFAATLLFFSLSLCFLMTSANVVLIGNNVTLSFPSLQANFAPSIKSSGIRGVLYVAEPIDACSELSNEVGMASNRFALILRGGCGFDEKVRRAQHSGFKAAIIYDDQDSGVLISMAGNPTGVKIPAVFVTKSTGETLKKYAGSTDSELWLIPTFENSAWSIMAISFISLLAISAMLATCFFVRRHRIRREQSLAPRVREFHGMSKRLVKAMPSLIFTSVLDDNCTSSTCAICLEDYSVGDRLRVLPCRHKFHASCVDSWLTTWRTFCPVCKRDARTSTGEPPASESTPLLSSNTSSIASSSALSSFRSSTSSAIPINPAASSRSTSISHIPSLSGASLLQQSLRSSYRQSSPLNVSHSSADLRRMSSRQSVTSYLYSPHSLGYPSISPLNSRYMSPYIPSASNGSTSYLIGSSSRPPHPLRHSESAASFSPYASAHSLPES